MSNIHHYQNVHRHHIEEKMHDQEHCLAHRMVPYRRDRRSRTIFEYQFFDRDDSV